MASTIMRLEVAFRKNPLGSEDDLFLTTTRLPNAAGYRLGDSQATARVLRNYLQQIDSGSFPGIEYLQLDEISSVESARGFFATVVVDNATLIATDTITVGGVVFTWQVVATNENEITIGATSNDSATNLALAISTHSETIGLLHATATAAVVMARTMGVSRWGHLITIATSNAVAMVLSGTRFLPDVIGSVQIAADPNFTITAASWDAALWSMLVGQEIDAFDNTITTQVNTFGTYTVVSVDQTTRVVTLQGNAADLAALAPNDVFVPVNEAQTVTQRMNYGANSQ